MQLSLFPLAIPIADPAQPLSASTTLSNSSSSPSLSQTSFLNRYFRLMSASDTMASAKRANEERRRSKDSPLRPVTDDLAKLIFLEAISKDLLAAAGATVDEHGDRLAPLHVREFAGAIAISDLHRRRSRVEQIKILGDRATPTIAQVPD